jgi:hypothetical protein
MLRKFTVLFLIALYVVSVAGVSVFAAKAKYAGDGSIDPRGMGPIGARKALLDTELEQAGKPSSDIVPMAVPAGQESSFGFRQVSPFPQLVLGTSAYDIQHNSRMGRQIARGSDGRIHLLYTYRATTPASGAGIRATYYNSYLPGSGFSHGSPQEISDAREGHMVNLDVAGNKALAVWRYGAAFTAYRTTTALDFASGTASFTIVDLPLNLTTCAPENFVGTLHYIWPVVAGDLDGSGDPVSHICVNEAESGAGFANLTYWKGTGSTFTTYTACGKWIDSTTNVSADIAQDPNSDEIAIAYTKGRQSGDRENCDVAYRKSTDAGTTWGPIVNVTQYATGAMERASNEVSALYSSDGCLHIIWTAVPYDSVGGSVSQAPAKLRHWDDCLNCQSLILDANNVHANCNMKAFEWNVCRVNISECTVGGNQILYATYTRYEGDTDPGTPAGPDCSLSLHPNGEIFASASSTDGETWGPPVNLTQTVTNGCAAGACDDDNFSTCARYNVDSLRIEFMNDKEAGAGAGNEAEVYTANPMIMMSVPCFSMATFRSLSSTPASVIYPFHTTVGGTANQNLVLTNAGNATANWTRSISYLNGSGWITCPASGAVTAGCTNSATIGITAGGASITTEGLYRGTITFTYEGPTAFDVDIDLYVFNSFFLPQNAAIRTATTRCNVNQAGRQADQESKYDMYSFSEGGAAGYLFDGSLIVGTSAANLSWLIFEGGTGGPTTSNPFGPLYALSNNVYDSTSNARYRTASGVGTNRDSSIAFDVTYYAPKHPDTNEFIIAVYDLYAGPKNPGATIPNVMVAWAGDFDVPDDSSENDDNYDATNQAVWQNAAWAPNTNRVGGAAAYRGDNQAIDGGYVWINDHYVYPNSGFENDSVWKYTQLTSGFGPAGKDSTTDRSSVLVIDKNLTISPARAKFRIIVAIFIRVNANGLTVQQILAKIKAWLCAIPALALDPFCAACTECGDADSSGGIDISDAVFLIQFIFQGGPAPADCNYTFGMGDADGSGGVDISDAVYLIQYIFQGGPAPHCM